MKTIFSLVLVSGLVPLAACAPKVNDPADVKAITQVMADYVKAINAKDTPGSVAIMTDTTNYYEAHRPAFVGKDAIARFHQGFFDAFDIQLAAPVVDVRVSGDLALVQGSFAQTVTPRMEGVAPIRDSGHWTASLRRQAGGKWMLDWMMGNSDQPMSGTTADGAEEQAIVQIERVLTDAVVKRDIPTLETCLGKEWMATNDGQPISRTQILTELKSGVYKVESDAIRDLNVYVFGDVAVATMILDTKGTYKGADFSGAIRSTDFFVKRDGRWQVVNSQNVTIKP